MCWSAHLFTSSSWGITWWKKVWVHKCMSGIFLFVHGGNGFWGVSECRPYRCCHFCSSSSKERPAKHRGTMCPSKSGWYEAWGLRPPQEMEGWDWLMQKLRSQDVTLSTVHCHSASAHTDPVEELLDQVQHLTVSGVDNQYQCASSLFIKEIFLKEGKDDLKYC